ncbi:MAG: NADH-dependent oxidoreductase [Oenococcus sp.]|uniref:oxidoreductase n=1 Tax=Oenococcus TaxID=46254 RepID=UPI0021E73B7F|nr:NADH-dependent oxidoreductase [Oenococcus kitaharae]MCV3296796.1 NADH-dependent oxidoreductase [Oenococcus kitaharae]
MSKYDKLFEKITLGNGTAVQNRFMLAPMCDDSSNGGKVTDQQVEYLRIRAANVGVADTGYAYVNDSGIQIQGQLSAAHDDDIPGLTKLAAAMKAGGAKAILQFSHAGRDAMGSQKYGNRVYAPSKVDFPWVHYDFDEMSQADIEQVLDDYKNATRRAIEAGFDGIEIHNCNHDLLQQFFSTYSNRRTDKWGGSLEKRMAFPLAVLKSLKEAVAEAGKPDFIIGWRISPEERHGDSVGYDVDDMIAQMKEVFKIGIDYLNLSLNLAAGYNNAKRLDYNAVPVGHTKRFATIFRELAGNVPVYVGTNIFTADQAMDAVDDEKGQSGVYVGREMLIDPEFVLKIKENREDEIVRTTTIQHLKDVKLPDGFVDNYADTDGSTRSVSYRKGIPLPGLD